MSAAVARRIRQYQRAAEVSPTPRAPVLRLFTGGIYVDNFAGGGGASEGFVKVFGRDPDFAINHDPEALAMHAANHPKTKHLVDDVFHARPRDITAGRRVRGAWFSPDCTFHSKARGGKPHRDTNLARRRRGLAWVGVKWAEQVRPDVLFFENVEEFQAWGPISKKTGAPDPAQKGAHFRRWCKRLRDAGYVVEWRELVACDYGAPTKRKRLYVIARCDGNPIVWPTPSHGPGRAQPYRTAAECIDWTIPALSIFATREEARAFAKEHRLDGVPQRPLAEKTLRRIARGIKRYVLDAEDPFIVPLRGNGDDHGAAHSVDEPLSTVSAGGTHHGLVTPFLTPVTHQGDDRTHDARDPLPTITGAHRGELAVVSPFLTEFANGSTDRNFAADEPLRTQCAGVKGGHFAAVAPLLVQTGYGEREGQEPRALNVHEPLGTIVAGGVKHAAVTAFMASHFGRGENDGSDFRAPMPTITSRDHHAPVVAQLALFGRPPMTVIPGVRDRRGQVMALLVKYYGNEVEGHDLQLPLGTITTKDRFGLVTIRTRLHEIVDIAMRMLQPKELFRATGFRDDYVIDPVHEGKRLTKGAQVRMCGNAVAPDMAAAIIAANLHDEPQKAAA